jgi:hypothetical protein
MIVGFARPALGDRVAQQKPENNPMHSSNRQHLQCLAGNF